mmetsp:Transcript_7616/g.46987  ORF Transcript_7616/g.46987 Transcript_7616/m.46987 type:complete len:108 (-) Transcript_7616:1477-1800(-)
MAYSATLLQRWLYLAAGLRLLSVYVGLFQVEKFRTNLFPLATNQVTDLYGRTFATWTSVTCVLCIVCARNVSSPAIYGACAGTGRIETCIVNVVRRFGPCRRRGGWS